VKHNLRELSRRQIRGYVASRWQKTNLAGSKDQKPPDGVGKYVRVMWQRLRRGTHRSRYRLRKQVVEPVFGQIKQARGFRQFLLRGETKVAGEWSLLCTAQQFAQARCGNGVRKQEVKFANRLPVRVSKVHSKLNITLANFNYS